MTSNVAKVAGKMTSTIDQNRWVPLDWRAFWTYRHGDGNLSGNVIRCLLGIGHLGGGHPSFRSLIYWYRWVLMYWRALRA